MVVSFVLCAVPIQVQAKDSRSVQATVIPTGPKAPKPQLSKTADKGKKQVAVKKKNVDTAADAPEDKNQKTKPQVTHELSMVCSVM